MTREQLDQEIDKVLKSYTAEIDKNGGREGSTLAHWLKAQLKILEQIRDKYYY